MCHLKKAQIEHIIGRSFDAAVAGAIVSSPLLKARIVTHLVRAGIDNVTAAKIAPHIIKRLAKEPLLAFNTAKLNKDIARQIADVVNAEKAIDAYKQLKKDLPTLDDLVKQACSHPEADSDSHPEADPGAHSEADPGANPDSDPQAGPGPQAGPEACTHQCSNFGWVDQPLRRPFPRQLRASSRPYCRFGSNPPGCPPDHGNLITP